MRTLVLLRHGQSQWNLENRFTGWVDVDLSELGREEAHRAGQELKKAGFTFDLAFTSVLKRAIRTLWISLDELDQMWLPVEKSWRLNERHYGALQGLNKAEMAEKYGKDQVFQWRRSYNTPPPALAEDDERHPRFDPRYGVVDRAVLPAAESLELTLQRVLPYWHSDIAPQLQQGKRLLVAAHGNSLRAMVKYLDNVSDDEITELNIPTGIPLVYELDDQLKPIKHYYLGDAATIAASTEAAKSATQVKGK